MLAFVRFSYLISLIGDERLWSGMRDVLACDTESVFAIHSPHTPTLFYKYAVYSILMLLLIMSIPCTYVILNGIVQSIIVLMLVAHTVNLLKTPCHICVCHGFV